VSSARTAGLLVAGLVALAGCGGGQPDSGRPVIVATTQAASPFRGTVLDRPLPKPSVTLTATTGDTVDLATATAGQVVALYVGYTHCPDVCPTTMADLSVAVRSLPAADRGKVSVVMITSDPARDTPARLREWLGAFDPTFVGLTGRYADVATAAHEVGIPIEPPVRQPDGTWVVDHGAQVLLYSPRTGTAQLVFTSGFTPADVAHDMNQLIEGVDP
jgi:protein SCO1/2